MALGVASQQLDLLDPVTRFCGEALPTNSVSTGCFEREDAAVTHLVGLRTVLGDHGITARIGFLTSVVRSDAAFADLAEAVAPFVLRLTAECFTRRDLLLKASKARLSYQQMPDLLYRARRAGLGTSFTYIVGLDPLPELRAGVAALSAHVTEFPNFQVYQAHNSIMTGLRTPGAGRLEFYLCVRAEIEQPCQRGRQPGDDSLRTLRIAVAVEHDDAATALLASLVRQPPLAG